MFLNFFTPGQHLDLAIIDAACLTWFHLSNYYIIILIYLLTANLTYWLVWVYASLTHLLILLWICSTLNITVLRTILIFRGQWLADILDRDVLILSRKAIGIFTLLFAYMDLVAPLNVSFTMFLLTGSAEVR